MSCCARVKARGGSYGTRLGQLAHLMTGVGGGGPDCTSATVVLYLRGACRERPTGNDASGILLAGAVLKSQFEQGAHVMPPTTGWQPLSPGLSHDCPLQPQGTAVLDFSSAAVGLVVETTVAASVLESSSIHNGGDIAVQCCGCCSRLRCRDQR
jgi:hypothetical protein